MWRRLLSSHLETLSPWRSSLRNNLRNIRPLLTTTTTTTNPSSPQTITPFQRTGPIFSSDSGGIIKEKKKKTVEDVMPIATGHEREEIEADLLGRSLSEMDYPVGPFGTKESPAIIKSTFDKRIVGCSGGEDEDEHDVIWFWLEKDKPHECPVCSQYFVLEVVGPGGPPDGHGDDDDHHH